MDNNQFGAGQAPGAPQRGGASGNNNTVMAVLAYLGILIIIPFLTNAKNDPFVKFHLKQGLVLLITWVVIWVLGSFLGGGYSYSFGLMGLIMNLLNLGLLVLMILGIINAVQKKEKELPLIGKFASMFNF